MSREDVVQASDSGRIKIRWIVEDFLVEAEPHDISSDKSDVFPKEHN